MSNPKITAKNLSYDSSLPPFLQRLRGNFNASNDGRHETEILRPKRVRDPNADDDDAPTYVDEDTHETLSKEDYAALVNGDAPDAESAVESDGSKHVDAPEEQDATRTVEKIAGIGAAKKRKVGKVVGGGDEDNEVPRKSKEQSTGAGGQETGGTKKTDMSKPKKSKKIKLSFNDDEGS